MEHATATDITALMAEVEAMEADWAVTDARLEALLARPVAVSLTSQLAALQRLSAQATAELDAIEAEQAAISAQLDALEQDV